MDRVTRNPTWAPKTFIPFSTVYITKACKCTNNVQNWVDQAVWVQFLWACQEIWPLSFSISVISSGGISFHVDKGLSSQRSGAGNIGKFTLNVVIWGSFEEQLGGRYIGLLGHTVWSNSRAKHVKKNIIPARPPSPSHYGLALKDACFRINIILVL